MDNETRTEPDGYAIVAGHWPLVGPYSPIRTAYAAQALTALVRYLTVAAETVDGLPTPEDAVRIETAVREALTGLPEVLSAVERRRFS